MEKNAQKPMAWIWQFPDGEFYETPHRTKAECEQDCCGYDGVAIPLYTGEFSKNSSRWEWCCKNPDRAVSVFENLGPAYFGSEVDMFMKEKNANN